MLCLEYLREYRTYEHLAVDYRISVATCHRVCRWVEDTLIRHPNFHLPGKKDLKQIEMQYEVVVIDAAESPIQRPKKRSEMDNGLKTGDLNKENFIQVKRKDMLTKAKW